MTLVLAVGRVPKRRGRPEEEGGFKVYLTTIHHDKWVELGGGGRKNQANGLPPQKRNGLESRAAAWQWVEENLLTNDELVKHPLRFHDLWPYNPSALHMAEIFFETVRPLDYLEQDIQLFESNRDVTLYEAPKRPNQKAFRDSVFARYGQSCAFCDIDHNDLLDAAHIIAWKDKGADVPENGLVLCKLHHSAIDAGLIRIDPESYVLHFANGHKAERLHVEVPDINHLPAKPHPEALRWLWERSQGH